MLNKSTFAVGCLVLSQAVFAVDRVGNVDFDRVNWSLLCERVGAIVFEQEDKQCPVSHPASAFHNKKIHQTFAEQAPEINLCEKLESEYGLLTEAYGEGRNKWQMCRLSFKRSLMERLATPELYQHDTNTWIKAHFNRQTMR